MKFVPIWIPDPNSIDPDRIGLGRGLRSPSALVVSIAVAAVVVVTVAVWWLVLVSIHVDKLAVENHELWPSKTI